MKSRAAAAASSAASAAAASPAPSAGSSALLSSCWSLMRDFARRTGLISEDGSPLPTPLIAATAAAAAGTTTSGVPNARRYLWTDAFATCNFLSLARAAPAGSTQASSYEHLATTTIHHVHAVLAAWRADEAHTPQRKGWLRSAHPGGMAADQEHPTRAGLRIGKKLPEVPMASTSSAVASAALDDWDRDGQYFHYLTKHMHALDQTARALRKPIFNRWARELADAAHRAFVYHSPQGMSIHWKMSTDLSRPVVTGAGSHDAIDGLISAVQLQHTAQQLASEAELEGPMLEEAIADYTKMVGGSDSSRWVTTDSLGIGGLLMDAARVEQLDRMRGEPMSVKSGRTLLEMLLAATVHSLLLFHSQFDPSRDADSRLAFRELGLAIGLAGVERMVAAQKAGKFSGNAASAKALDQLARFVPLRSLLSSYWSASDHQRVSTWTEHENINATMLATALVPEGFIDIEYLAPSAVTLEAPTQKERPSAAAMVDEEKKEEVSMASEMKAPQPPVRPAEPAPTAAAAFTPASARAQPPMSEANLQHLRNVAMTVDVEAIMAAEARIPNNPIGDPALSVANRPAWLTALLNSIGDARVVMIGEASHGTEEFYRVRAYITQHLLMHHGFDFVAVEGDFPDVYSIQRYVTDSDDRLTCAEDALASFGRFPRWMWANHATRDFIEWMKGFNREKRREMHARQATQEPAASVSRAAPPAPPLAGIYGLDLYSMFTSADEVIRYLDEHNPAAANHARERYGELENFREEPSEYGIAVACGLVESQQQAVVGVLVDLVRRSHDYLADSGFAEGDELVASKLNALVVKDAEKYYRASLQGGHVSWNQRDSHFKDVLLTLLQVYSDRKREALGKAPMGAAAERALATTEKETVGQILRSSVFTGDDARAIVWAHNSHVGDARATAREERDEWNIGQLVREKLGHEATFNVGFSTFTGTVSAARRWGGERETMNVRPGLPDGYEQLFHEVAARVPVAAESKPNFMFLLRSNDPNHSKVDAGAFQLLRNPSRLQRAIGVQYVPATERQSHYFRATLPRQFDALLHFDTTRALEPLAPATPAQRAKIEERKRKEKSQAPMPPESEEDEDALQD